MESESTGAMRLEPYPSETFSTMLGFIVDVNIPVEKVEDMAWGPIVAQWTQGYTNALVCALLKSNIDLQQFLAQLLRRIWCKLLGEKPQVIGTYKASFPHKASAPPAHSAFATDMHRFLDCAHPGIDKLNLSINPWGNHYHPPAIPSWAPTSSHVTTTDHNPPLLTELLNTAKYSHQDLNAVLIRAIPHYAHGLTEIGLSAEVRAFWACYLISLYSPSPEVTRFQTSPRNIHFIDAVTHLNDEYASYIYAQLLPTVLQVQHNSVSSIGRWHSIPALPLLYFFVHMAERSNRSLSSEVVGMIEAAIDQLHAQRDHFPVLAAHTEDSRVSLATVVAWILEWRLVVSHRIKTRSLAILNSGAPPNQTYRRPIGWMSFTTVSDVNACMDTLQNFGLNEIWQNINSGFQDVIVGAILKDAPSKYNNQIEVVCRELLEAYTNDQTTDERRTRIAHRWIEFVALEENYVEAFRNTVLQLDKVHAKTAFAYIIKLFNPMPEKNEAKQMNDLQHIYGKVAYASSETLPSYLVERFIQIMTPLARYSTILAQALCEAGMLTLLAALRDGWYIFPETDSSISKATQTSVRHALCTAMLNALSERMYLAAQSRIMKGSSEMYTHAPSRTKPTVRRRPSWMATGG